jgi:hypothetical protein
MIATIVSALIRQPVGHRSSEAITASGTGCAAAMEAERFIAFFLEA